MDQQNNDRLLRLPDVLKIVPISRAAWYNGIKAGKFPRAVRLGKRCAAWRMSDVQDVVATGWDRT